ncbi:hypothetical protein AR457_42040 (plasmid) [Streptomyces agglomeratus]|uniref:hypothetical protein n=1 Tax=Streptomyces agglomeratus TaxID=285458 RepID=UPI0008547778|nr:hypothetical protein [Streptomyces agglomeratus]OEJ20849.1 hypothetical protein AR457_42040 [Streptomyces agglomeratus]
MSDTFWEALGAIGGTLAFGGVVWQASLTRASLKVSQLMTADAIRARLDSQAPEIRLKLSPPPWEPLAWTNAGMPCNPWPQRHTWHFPADQEGANRLVLQQGLVLENLSDRRVEARFDGDLVVSDENRRPSAAGVILLEPGDSSPEVYLQRDFTIKELSENFEAKEAGGQELPHKVLGTVTVADDRDNGSTDRWDLVLTGCPVEPVPDRHGLWMIAPWHLTEGPGRRTLDYSLLPPRQRIHWVSRTRGIKLATPDGA